MKNVFQKKVLPIPIYSGCLIIINSNSKERVSKNITDWVKDKNDIYASAWHTNYNGYDGYAVILNFQNENNKITHGAIAHEALHLTNYLADLRGIIADFNNDEPLTYLLAWIVDQIYIFIEENDLKVHLKNI